MSSRLLTGMEREWKVRTVLKKIRKVFQSLVAAASLSALAVVFAGCSVIAPPLEAPTVEPGYVVEIKVDELTAGDVILLEKKIKGLNYEVSSPWERTDYLVCSQFSKKLTRDKSIEHPFVDILVCYEDDQDGKDPQALAVMVVNEWIGGRSDFKREIESSAGSIKRELVRLLGPEGVTSYRSVMEPPF